MEEVALLKAKLAALEQTKGTPVSMLLDARCALASQLLQCKENGALQAVAYLQGCFALEKQRKLLKSVLVLLVITLNESGQADEAFRECEKYAEWFLLCEVRNVAAERRQRLSEDDCAILREAVLARLEDSPWCDDTMARVLQDCQAASAAFQGRNAWVHARLCQYRGHFDAAFGYCQRAVSLLSKQPLFCERAQKTLETVDGLRASSFPHRFADLHPLGIKIDHLELSKVHDAPHTCMVPLLPQLSRHYESEDERIFYFEVEVLDPGKKNGIGIGLSRSSDLSPSSFLMMPGRENGMGFHADTGHLSGDKSSFSTTIFGSRGVGVILGCYWDRLTGMAGFTLNGSYTPFTQRIESPPLWAVVGLWHVGGRVRVNLGETPWKCPVPRDFAEVQRCEVESRCSITYTQGRAVMQPTSKRGRKTVCVTCLKVCHAGNPVTLCDGYLLSCCDCGKQCKSLSSPLEVAQDLMHRVSTALAGETAFQPLLHKKDYAQTLAKMMMPEYIKTFDQATELFLRAKKGNNESLFWNAVSLGHPASTYELGLIRLRDDGDVFFSCSAQQNFSPAFSAPWKQRGSLGVREAVYWKLQAIKQGLLSGEPKLWEVCGGPDTAIECGPSGLYMMVSPPSRIGEIISLPASDVHSAKDPHFSCDALATALLKRATFDVACDLCASSTLVFYRFTCIDCRRNYCVKCFVQKRSKLCHDDRNVVGTRDPLFDWASPIVCLREADGPSSICAALDGKWKGAVNGVPFSCDLSFAPFGDVRGTGDTKGIGSFSFCGCWVWEDGELALKSLALEYLQGKKFSLEDGVYRADGQFSGTWDKWFLKRQRWDSPKAHSSSSVRIEQANCKVLHAGQGNVTYYEKYVVEVPTSEALREELGAINAHIKQLVARGESNEALLMFQAELAVVESLETMRLGLPQMEAIVLARAVLTKVKMLLLWCKQSDLSTVSLAEQMCLCVPVLKDHESLVKEAVPSILELAQTLLAGEDIVALLRQCGEGIALVMRRIVPKLVAGVDSGVIANGLFVLLVEAWRETREPRAMAAVLVEARETLLSRTMHAFHRFMAQELPSAPPPAIMAPTPLVQGMHATLRDTLTTTLLPRIDEMQRSIDGMRASPSPQPPQTTATQKLVAGFSVEQLCAWLLERGIPADSVDILKAECISGEALLTFASASQLRQELQIPLGNCLAIFKLLAQ